MDLTAFTLCMERTMDVVVFNIWEPGSLRRIALGEPIGTTVRRAKLKEV
jgi:uridylate kinase